jgi:hypothetical protein
MSKEYNFTNYLGKKDEEINKLYEFIKGFVNKAFEQMEFLYGRFDIIDSELESLGSRIKRLESVKNQEVKVAPPPAPPNTYVGNGLHIKKPTPKPLNQRREMLDELKDVFKKRG